MQSPSCLCVGAEYCMFISAPGAIFLLYLAILVSLGSETVYSVPKSRFESAIVLFLCSFVYAALFAFSYYTKYMNIQRQDNIERWINEHDIREAEMETFAPQQQPQPLAQPAPVNQPSASERSSGYVAPIGRSGLRKVQQSEDD